MSVSAKDKWRRAKFKMKHNFFTVENVVLILAIIMCLVWAYQSIEAMSKNWELSERLATGRKELELTKMEVETAELENEYYKTNEYQEIIARKTLDRQLDGENMVVLPENSDEAKTRHSEQKVEIINKEYTNFEKWMKYLFPDNR